MNDTHTIGTDDVQLVLRDQFPQGIFQAFAYPARFLESGRDDDQVANASLSALLNGLKHQVSIDRKNGKIGRFGKPINRPVTGESQHRIVFRIDRVDVPGESTGLQIAQDGSRDGTFPRTCTDNSYCLRSKQLC